MSFETLAIDSNGTVLSFTDSGPPENKDYITVFAVHGIACNGLIFKKVQALARANNIRFVAINRRPYIGSTPYTEAESVTLCTGSETEKAHFIDARGIEFATFVETFVQKYDLPPISPDGKSGGVALLGWSAGNLVTAAALNSLGKLPPSSQDKFKLYLRAHIMHEPPSVIFGLPAAPLTWSPYVEASVPAKMHPRLATQWLSAYFDHGDLSANGVDAIEYIVPSLRCHPSFYSMSSSEVAEIADESISEFPGMFMRMEQANDVYRRVCYGPECKSLAPLLKTTLIVGEATISFRLTALLSIRADNSALGGDIRFSLVDGANHFVQWDEPDKAIKTYLEAL
ncbi:hypothetical protein DFH09DRAFT_942672 [Mycena vulgaris]|nr:hypothetical protein DFH09DRAFT_942672 [Mycena vulgaris]